MPDLAIDTDSIFHRIYNVVRKKEYFREDMAGRNKLINDVDNFCNMIGKKIPHRNMYMTMDSADSWRNKIYDEYKGNRKDQDRVFLRSCMDEFAVIKIKAGGCILKFPTYEGDDIVAGIADVNMKRGISTVIVSSDSDLNQLVQCNEDGTFIVQYDPDANKRMFYINKNYAPKESSIFDDHMIDDLFGFTQQDHKMINPHEKLIVKIVAGETGDNIPSCYPAINGKNRSFGEVSGTKIAAMFGELPLFINEDSRRTIVSQILKIGHSKETSRIAEISANIIRNIRLIYLHEDYIHEYDVLKKMITAKIN